MFARREEISIQKMVGATNWFIRWPFVIEGMIIGLVAGGLAFLAEWGLYTELYSVAGGVIPYFEILPFESLKWLVLAVFAGAGAPVRHRRLGNEHPQVHGCLRTRRTIL